MTLLPERLFLGITVVLLAVNWCYFILFRYGSDDSCARCTVQVRVLNTVLAKDVHEVTGAMRIIQTNSTFNETEATLKPEKYHTLGLPICPQPAINIGQAWRLNTSHVAEPLSELEKRHQHLVGVHPWRPRDCVARHSVAFIVPFRGREEHLSVFLNHLHPILKQQNIEYAIYIIEQVSPLLFNRGALLNAGFLEVLREPADYDCYILHDVDMLLEDGRHLYRCWDDPMHMGAFIKQTNYTRRVVPIVGGVLAIKPDQFIHANGFSNTFWGWGGEDNDMYNRLVYHKGYQVAVPMKEIGRFTMIQHDRDQTNPESITRYRGNIVFGTDYYSDGLNSARYRVAMVKRHNLFVKYQVHLLQDMYMHDELVRKFHQQISQ